MRVCNTEILLYCRYWPLVYIGRHCTLEFERVLYSVLLVSLTTIESLVSETSVLYGFVCLFFVLCDHVHLSDLEKCSTS